MGLGPKLMIKKFKNSFILSKGHAAPALYVVLKEKVYFEKLLKTYCKPGVFRGT